MMNPSIYDPEFMIIQNYREPREFTCMDDSPLNNGWGYQDEFEEIEEVDEDIPLENDED